MNYNIVMKFKALKRDKLNKYLNLGLIFKFYKKLGKLNRKQHCIQYLFNKLINGFL